MELTLLRLSAIWPKWLHVTCSALGTLVSRTVTNPMLSRCATRTVAPSHPSALPWRQARMEATQCVEIFPSHSQEMAQTMRKWSSSRGSSSRLRLRMSDSNTSATPWSRTIAVRLRLRRTLSAAWTSDLITRVTWPELTLMSREWWGVRMRLSRGRTSWCGIVSLSLTLEPPLMELASQTLSIVNVAVYAPSFKRKSVIFLSKEIRWDSLFLRKIKFLASRKMNGLRSTVTWSVRLTVLSETSECLTKRTKG